MAHCQSSNSFNLVHSLYFQIFLVQFYHYFENNKKHDGLLPFHICAIMNNHGKLFDIFSRKYREKSAAFNHISTVFSAEKEAQICGQHRKLSFYQNASY